MARDVADSGILHFARGRVDLSGRHGAAPRSLHPHCAALKIEGSGSERIRSKTIAASSAAAAEGTVSQSVGEH